jgi:hypothetical protein
MAIPNQIVIDSPTNTVEIQTNNNQLTVISEVCNTEVSVTQPVTSIIQVTTPGPKGDKGDTGNTGTAITNQITTGSITASVNVGTDTFRIQSGSSTFLYISSSGNVGIGTILPTNTLQVVGGITATSFTGSLLGTSSNIFPAITNNVNNRVLTATGGGTINAETDLTFNGSDLTVGGVTNTSTLDTQVLNTTFVASDLLPTDFTYDKTLGNSSRTWNQVWAGTNDGSKTIFFGEDLANNPTKLFIRTDNSLTIRGQQGITMDGATDIASLTNGTLTNSVLITTPSLTSTNLANTNSASFGGSFTPTARVHISGASNSNLLRVGSPTDQNILFVSGSGTVGIGTTTPINTLQVVGGITAISFTGSLLGTASLAATQSKTISFNVGSVTNALTTGSKATTTFYCPYNGKIKGFYLTSNVPATTTLDVWKASNTVPTSNANSIISSNKPQLTGNQITSSYNVSGWTTPFSVDDVFVVEVEVNTGASFINLQLITEIYN